MVATGSIGDRGADGWVSWTTVDSAWSYNPSISCGHFAIVASRGTMWGAPSDEHGCAAIIDLANEYDEAEVGCESFVWSMESFVAVALEIAERYEHPQPSNVAEAARDMWVAMLMSEGE